MRWSCLCAALLIGGCHVGTPYHRPETTLPSSWDAPLPAGFVASGDWWGSFGDPQLQALLERAIRGSPDMRIAVNRILEARAMARVARSYQFPNVGFGAQPADQITSQYTTIDKGGTIDIDADLIEVGLYASYTIDFWKRLQQNTTAARADREASEFDAGVVEISLRSAVARAYFDIRRYDEEIAIGKQREGLAKESLRLARMRQAAGRADAGPVIDAEQAQYQAQARLSKLRLERTLALHDLAVLIGENPGSLEFEPAPLRKTVTAAVPPEGLPSSLLERRPDLRAAESRLQAAHARANVARAELFPNIALTAKYGYVSGDVRNLPKVGSTIAGIGPEISYPLYDAGRGEAVLDASLSRRDAALNEYRKAVLVALSDVERALLNYQACVEAAERNTRMSEMQRAQVRRVESALASGRTSGFDVIAAKERMLELDADALHNHRDRLDSLVALYQAMGGGWSVQDLPMPTEYSANKQ